MPSTTTAEQKARLRAEITERLSIRTAERKAESQNALFAQFLNLPELKRAEDILFYVGVGDEPDTRLLFPQLVETGKRVWLPRCLPGHGMEFRLWRPERAPEAGAYGIPEPGTDAPLWTGGPAVLAVVPGVAFDRLGRRLGRGGGYYDRFLAGFQGLTIALCPNEQLADAVPVREHDKPVDILVCEDEVCYLNAKK